MNKFFLLASMILLTMAIACQKDNISQLYDQHNQSEYDSHYKVFRDTIPAKAGKITVCHYDKSDGSWHIINISENAWPAHQRHGDVRLDDQDNDGLVPDNECGYGNMGDYDDGDKALKTR